MAELHAAIDIFDDIVSNNLFPDQRHLRGMMAYLRSLGVTQVAWIFDDLWSIYDDYPGGFDLLAEAVEAAHRAGLALHVVYKPFEGALHAYPAPHAAPRPAEAPMWEDLRGLLPAVRPFVAQHPEWCLRLDPAIVDRGLALQAVELAIEGASPTGLTADDVRLFTGAGNGELSPCDQRFELSERAAPPNGLADDPPRRILRLEGLSIPARTPYLELKLTPQRALPPRVAAGSEPLAFFDTAGDPIPLTMADPPEGARHWLRWREPVFRRLTRWSSAPEVGRFLDDDERIDALRSGMRLYDNYADRADVPLFGELGVGAARGRPRYLAGAMSPLHEPVRAHWLERLAYCLDRGVDGVNIRHSMHLRTRDARDYGFDPPVLETGGPDVTWEDAATRLDEAYTVFLREAADLTHRYGKLLGVHLFASFLKPLTERAVQGRRLPGIGLAWRTWIEDIADYAEYRGGVGGDAQRMTAAVGPFAQACRAAGKPLIYQSLLRLTQQIARHQTTLPGPVSQELAAEMRLSTALPGVTAYELYETASYIRLRDDGEATGAASLAAFLKTNPFESTNAR